MHVQRALQTVIEGRDLSHAEMGAAMEEIMAGEATPAQIGGFLIGLRMKGETVTELTAAAAVMRRLATRVAVADTHLVDTCGTGGDGSGTFNISTTSAFVVAAAGGRVAKHGNRAVSGRSGSADVLEAAGVKIDLDPSRIAPCIEELGVGFMYAPLHHGAMRHTRGPRQELGVRTLFNLLGPLTNPAGARRQLLGVYRDDWTAPLARVLGNLGSVHVMVVHGSDGLDEISLSGPTHVAELRDGRFSEWPLHPEDFGFQRAGRDAIAASSTAESLALMRAALSGRAGPALDIVLLNAGAAIYVSGIARDLAEGIARARAAVLEGRALKILEGLIELTNRPGG